MRIRLFRRIPGDRPGTGRFLPIAVGLLMIMFNCGNESKGGTPMTLQLTSPAFSANETIPQLYTCDGSDISPPLAWSGLPPGTRSLALIVDDPDAPDPRAPKRTWVHWLLYNLPADTGNLEENAGVTGLHAGALSGLNDWGRAGYGGPCPPIGRHRYFFKLYALDALLPDLDQPRKAELVRAIEGHILARSELVGTYQRNR